jgi:hypothetical protein
LKGNVATTLDLDQMKSLLGMEVVVEGTLAFRPSGRPLGIEVEHVAVAQAQDALWNRTPHGELPGEPLVTSGEELGPVFGQWPGEEDDEQL